jgi:hypothetical protein
MIYHLHLLPRVEGHAHPTVMASILILDGDLGFLFALSAELRKRSIAAIPSRTVGEAQTMLADIEPALSALVVNCERPGACAFAREMRRQDAALRVIGIRPEGGSCTACTDLWSATLRPRDIRPERIGYCAEVVEAVVYGERPARLRTVPIG